ncbi:hypothetical protein J6590_009911 [Homalodisca vitripennis]|nr:hypothetical protein J6590_009911 [Homalodisca vitripennis]
MVPFPLHRLSGIPPVDLEIVDWLFFKSCPLAASLFHQTCSHSCQWNANSRPLRLFGHHEKIPFTNSGGKTNSLGFGKGREHSYFATWRPFITTENRICSDLHDPSQSDIRQTVWGSGKDESTRILLRGVHLLRQRILSAAICMTHHSQISDKQFGVRGRTRALVFCYVASIYYDRESYLQRSAMTDIVSIDKQFGVREGREHSYFATWRPFITTENPICSDLHDPSQSDIRQTVWGSGKDESTRILLRGVHLLRQRILSAAICMTHHSQISDKQFGVRERTRALVFCYVASIYYDRESYLQRSA